MNHYSLSIWFLCIAVLIAGCGNDTDSTTGPSENNSVISQIYQDTLALRAILIDNSLPTLVLNPEIRRIEERGGIPRIVGLKLDTAAMGPGNTISRLNAQVSQLTECAYLHLDYQPITELPQEIGNMSSLTMLSARGCALTTLPASIGALSSLEDLFLNNNQISYLPPEIGSLASLKTLSLPGNNLTNLPSQILSLTIQDSLLVNIIGNQLCPASVTDTAVITWIETVDGGWPDDQNCSL